MKELEQKAIADFEALVGKIVLIGVVQGYKDESSVEIALDRPVFARIQPYDERGMREDVVRWMDDVIDPVYDIEVLTKHPEIDGLSSTFVYGRSYYKDGRVEQGHFVLASQDLVARYSVEGGDWKSPEMKVFEVTLPGFDGGTDETDHLVVWVAAPEAQTVEQMLVGTECKFWGEPEGVSLDDADMSLPADFHAFSERIKKSTEDQQAKAAPSI